MSWVVELCWWFGSVGGRGFLELRFPIFFTPSFGFTVRVSGLGGRNLRNVDWIRKSSHVWQPINSCVWRKIKRMEGGRKKGLRIDHTPTTSYLTRSSTHCPTETNTKTERQQERQEEDRDEGYSLSTILREREKLFRINPFFSSNNKRLLHHQHSIAQTGDSVNNTEGHPNPKL